MEGLQCCERSFILLRWDALVSEALGMRRPDVEELVELDRRVRKEPVLGEVVDVGGGEEDALTH
jgi:hypothetical protein